MTETAAASVPPSAADRAAAAAPACTVYFDGGCPVCSAEMSWYRAKAGEAAAFVDVAAAPAAPAPDLAREAALARLHVRTDKGELVSGARAFLALWATIPRLRLAARILSVPPLPSVLEAGYRAFLVVRPLWRR